MTTTVVHVRSVDWSQPPPDVVYIGRYSSTLGLLPSKWKNPFNLRRGATLEERTACIEKYEAWLRTQPSLMVALPELRGKRLCCWCSPLQCHGDVLARLAAMLKEEP